MLEFIKEKKGFRSYQVNTAGRGDGQKFKIYYGESGSVAGDNNINPAEVIYLIDGEVEITVEDKIETVKAPAEIKIPARTYHKIEALEKITMIVFVKD